jgi:hypothetical protein
LNRRLTWTALALILFASGSSWLWSRFHTQPAATAGADIGKTLAAYPWIYQRAGPPLSGSDTFHIILVGDILAGRGGKPPGSIQIPPAFQAADLLVGNLEGVFAEAEVIVAPGRLPYHLAGSAETAGSLEAVGFDLLGLANNHTLDLGSAGLQTTTQRLEQAGIAWVGAGESANKAGQARFWQAGPLKLAFLAVNIVPTPEHTAPGPGWRPAGWGEVFLNDLAAARQQADLVIVMAHWGYEYQPQVDPAQRRIAQRLLDGGADLVAGSHSHTVQEIQVVFQTALPGPQIVAYSLGNFIFDQGSMGNQDGLALHVVLDGSGIQGVQALPVQAGLQPTLITPDAAQSIVTGLISPTASVVFGCGANNCAVIDEPDLANRQQTVGLFWSGQCDLTGDQVDELVRREAGQVIVYQGGEETWRTPIEWRILDAALGDPDWDGRNEIVLAMLKPDADGVLRSHPFLMGYRGGIYRNLWGGSAVSDPILEIELGNVDEDPEPELIVLEERDSGLTAVTVWDWHGWGFSLRWRSPEALYQNLRLANDPNGGPAWIVVDAP